MQATSNPDTIRLSWRNDGLLFDEHIVGKNLLAVRSERSIGAIQAGPPEGRYVFGDFPGKILLHPCGPFTNLRLRVKSGRVCMKKALNKGQPSPLLLLGVEQKLQQQVKTAWAKRFFQFGKMVPLEQSLCLTAIGQPRTVQKVFVKVALLFEIILHILPGERPDMPLVALDNGHTLGHVLADAVVVIGEPIEKNRDRFHRLSKTGRTDDEISSRFNADAVEAAQFNLRFDVIGPVSDLEEISRLAIHQVVFQSDRKRFVAGFLQRTNEPGFQLTFDEGVHGNVTDGVSLDQPVLVGKDFGQKFNRRIP